MRDFKLLKGKEQVLVQGEYQGWLLWQAAAFIAGIALVQQLASNLSPYCYGLLPLLIGFWIWRPRWGWCSAFLLGLIWASMHAQLKLQETFPVEFVGQDMMVLGKLAACLNLIIAVFVLSLSFSSI